MKKIRYNNKIKFLYKNNIKVYTKIWYNRKIRFNVKYFRRNGMNWYKF